MKATIEVPDDLYRRVKAKSALQGRAIREVTIELYQTWLVEDVAPLAAPSPQGPSARELLAQDRALTACPHGRPQGSAPTD